jgi:hypothetical protein
VKPGQLGFSDSTSSRPKAQRHGAVCSSRHTRHRSPLRAQLTLPGHSRGGDQTAGGLARTAAPRHQAWPEPDSGDSLHGPGQNGKFCTLANATSSAQWPSSESAGISRPGVLEVCVTLGDQVVGSLRARSAVLSSDLADREGRRCHIRMIDMGVFRGHSPTVHGPCRDTLGGGDTPARGHAVTAQSCLNRD